MIPDAGPAGRGQSEVAGVALMMGLTVVAMGALTAGIGAVVEQNAAHADATRVASDVDAALRPVETTGGHRGRVSFADGRLSTVDRELRVLNESGPQHRIAVGGLVFEATDARVAAVAGGIVRGRPGNAWVVRPPPLTAPRNGSVIVVGAARLNASDRTVSAGGATTVELRTRVTHHRIALGNGTYRIAVETRTPAALERWFRERNASVSRRDFDADGVPSVVARFPGERDGYFVVHDMHLEVADG